MLKKNFATENQPHDDSATSLSSTQSPTSWRKVLLRNLELKASIGAYDEERLAPQRIILNIEIDVFEPDDPLSENLEDVLCYHKFSKGIQAILDEGHIVLVETLGERIVDLALANPLAKSIKVSIEKPDALAHANTVGVEIFRSKA